MADTEVTEDGFDRCSDPVNPNYEATNLKFVQTTDLSGSRPVYAQTPEWDNHANLEHMSTPSRLLQAATTSLPTADASPAHGYWAEGYGVDTLDLGLHANPVDPGTSQIREQDTPSNGDHVTNNSQTPLDQSFLATGERHAQDYSTYRPSSTVMYDCTINGQYPLTGTCDHGDYPFSTMSASCVKRLGIDCFPIPQSKQKRIRTPLGEKKPKEYCTLRRFDIMALNVTHENMNVQLLETNDARYEGCLHLGRNIMRKLGIEDAPGSSPLTK
ncbi:hypothetical protein QBC40DRAFT_253430 [Triangularia verruculosa]|uniref:Uncharacterized protein n=1 Tax=Triangularia verruculosa TaxID=2587418 RepID=A0AAN6XIV1_9PEZI|nr:hypothetical protein QBC40DRAFT_253430 [Triangularia verruculosa]